MPSPDRGATVLVTGASGFLAPAVCARLIADGCRVRGLVRSGNAPGGVEEARGDLLDRPSLRAALEGADVVVHLAARVHRPARGGSAAQSELAEFRAQNVEGTRNIIEESAAAGVRRFVHASSVKAVGEPGGKPLSETTAPRPSDPYGLSKLESEQVVAEVSARHGMTASLMRLPLSYGPGVRANMLSLFKAVDRGLPLPFGGIDNRRSLLYTGNLAAAVAAVLTLRHQGAEVFFVSDDDDVSTPQLLRLIAGALDRPLRLLPFPGAAATAMARMGDVIARYGPFPVRTDVLARLTGSLQVDVSRLRALTGYSPPFSVAEGIADTARWYRKVAA